MNLFSRAVVVRIEVEIAAIVVGVSVDFVVSIFIFLMTRIFCYLP
jgi:hypothetical protein